MLEQCPKCGRDGVEPTWHDHNDEKCSEKYYKHVNEDEHLHYKCKCGYDFTKSIATEVNEED